MSDGFADADTRFQAVKRDVEALLFASGTPLTVETLTGALAGTGGPSSDAIRAALAELADEYPPSGDRGFELVKLAGGWAFRTNPACQAGRRLPLRASG